MGEKFHLSDRQSEGISTLTENKNQFNLFRRQVSSTSHAFKCAQDLCGTHNFIVPKYSSFLLWSLVFMGI